MRGLTVRDPWGPAIIYLGKSPENRTRNIAGSYRGPVAIHSSRPRPDDAEYVRWAIHSPHFVGEEVRRYPALTDGIGALGGVPLVPGCIIGVAILVDVHHADWCWDGGYCTPWAQEGCYHLVLRFPKRLLAPIPWRGQQGLWKVPEAVETEIWRGLDEPFSPRR